MHAFVDTLKARKTEIGFFYQKIKEENQWSKRSVYFALLWQNILGMFIMLFTVALIPVLVGVFIFGALFIEDINIMINFVAVLIFILFLFLFELWILFILRKVYPKTKENLLKKLEGKS
ncbi:hypothetical protein P4475_09385 [Halalkalibacterium halodurans]|uniref:hypothetical protein n=1 Tax=Halalkalibacterium halodurans TaxID=86665 RepID=UPI002E1B2D98|nr:hypothetical protein [Halalkalibacterium halodurans]MED4161792.1 hypothetical protein [Halalkalibacterium halodurans]